jgi:hypothetical protein
MQSASDLVAALSGLDPQLVFKMVIENTWPRGGRVIEIRNEIRPSDLFCYLGGRFGQPNGIQNYLRADHSDNLIHWEWTLRHPDGIVSLQGHNFRTELHFYGELGRCEFTAQDLAEAIKADFKNYSAEMSRVRKALEPWAEFVNPVQRIQRTITDLLSELDDLNLDPDVDNFPDVLSASTAAERDTASAVQEGLLSRYRKGVGLCFAIRAMLPVLAESYVNFLLFSMMRPELRSDERIRENIYRQPIDIRIKTLALNCKGFSESPSFEHETCRRLHTLINERNDLLHGNIVVNKLKFNEVYFLGTVPIFREYRTMWERSIGVEIAAVGLREVRGELKTVQDFIEYLCTCIDLSLRDKLKQLSDSYELGLNTATGRLGCLFSETLVDFRAGPPTEETEQTSA